MPYHGLTQKACNLRSSVTICRTKGQSSSPWDDLPQELKLKIIGRMIHPTGDPNYLMLLRLRQVSRSWRAAVESFSGCLTLFGGSLEDYSPFLGNLSDLHIEPGSLVNNSLKALHSCSRLTSLNLENPNSSRHAAATFNASDLPASLRSLTSKFFSIPPEAVQQMHCQGLTGLSLTHTLSPASFDLLLPRLPNLQVTVTCDNSPQREP